MGIKLCHSCSENANEENYEIVNPINNLTKDQFNFEDITYEYLYFQI